MSSQQALPISIAAPAPAASSASSQKTEVAESEFSAHHNDQNAWAEWRLNQHRAQHYHLFPVVSRSPHTAYFPSGSPFTEPATMHHRPASESTTIRESRFSCCAVSGWGLDVHSSPSRMSHIKGTICVVMAIALIFIVVLVLALVSNKEKP